MEHEVRDTQEGIDSTCTKIEIAFETCYPGSSNNQLNLSAITTNYTNYNMLTLRIGTLQVDRKIINFLIIFGRNKL